MDPTVIAHMEQRLGRILGSVPGARHASWTVVFSQVPHRLCARMPVSFRSLSLSAVWTVGLSFTPLVSPQTGRPLRIELFTLCDQHDRFEAERVLTAVTEAVSTAEKPILRGQVIGPLPPEAGIHALYATMPMMFDDEFVTSHTEYGPVAIVWLLPIGAAEEAFIKEYGWHLFEERLWNRKDLDPSDWGRCSVV